MRRISFLQSSTQAATTIPADVRCGLTQPLGWLVGNPETERSAAFLDSTSASTAALHKALADIGLKLRATEQRGNIDLFSALLPRDRYRRLLMACRKDY